MEMVGEVRLEAPRSLVWDALNDAEVLKLCIPGCNSLVKDSDTQFSALVTSKVGPIKAQFEGKVELSNIQAPRQYTLTGEGQGGMAGFAKANIDVYLDAIEEKVTQLRYTVTANVGGKLAQLGSRLIDATARKMADDFFEKFSAAIASYGSVGDASEKKKSAMPEFMVMPEVGVAVMTPPEFAAAEGEVDQGAEPIALSTAPDSNITQDLMEVWTSDLIKLWISDDIAVVTINRPSSRNAMTYAMWRAIPGIFASLERNPEVRSIILTGAGDDFCAGADITEFSRIRDSVQQGTDYEVAVDACCDAIANVSKPTIAVLKGYCLGGGAHLAMSCDFRFAADSAVCGIPAAKLSIIYGTSGTKKLLSLVGISQAKKILYGGHRFDASEGLRIGFVDHVSQRASNSKTSWWQMLFSKSSGTIGSTDPMADARAFARTFSDSAPLTISGAKYILNGLAMGNGRMSSAHAEKLIAAAVGSDDYREGRKAFAEKRKPAFKGV